MGPRAALLLLLAAAVMTGQSGTVPKAGAEEYPVHTKLEKLSVGAEYLVHSFSGGQEMFIAKDYLVVEVAIFPAKGAVLAINADQFRLRVSGGKQALAPQSPQFVAASLKDPEWSGRPRTQVAGGAGPVIFGAPQPVERFPGDPNGRTQRAPRAPDANPTGEKEWSTTAPELALQTSLPEGEYHEPVSGYLYFPYRGKVKNIRSLELEFSGAVLKLQ